MEANLARAISILKQMHLFQGLETDQVARIASFFEPIDLESNTYVFSEGDRPDYFYVIIDGSVQVIRRVRGSDKVINTLSQGDFFGEQALLFDAPRNASVKTVEPTKLIRLGQVEFNRILEDYPDVRNNISATAESRKLVRKLKFNWLDEKEVIYYLVRKHWIFLVAAMIWPVLLGGFAFSIIIALGFQDIVALIDTPMGLFGIITIAIAVFWGIWRWIDWSNDYYVVTSRRVVWQEKIVALYDSRREAPLGQVLTVNVTTSWLGRQFDYGNVDVRTYTGSILMQRMENPKLFASFVEKFTKRAKEISKEEEIKKIEKKLQDGLQKSLYPEDEEIQIATAPPPLKKDETKKKQNRGLREILRTFLKVRYEEDGGKIITYRKHWFLLAKRIWLAFFVTLFVFLLFAWAFGSQVIPLMFSPFAFIFWIMVFGWLVYEYLDWSNDIYRLTQTQILDIERKPLGREVKKTASLGAPDFRVEHTRKNIIEILFNYGTVMIKVGDTDFTFYGVYNPDQVHQDVSDFREGFLQREREKQDDRENERMVNWLVAYYKHSGELEEEVAD